MRQLCIAIGEDPLHFGAHSLRIGGATALFASGAGPLHIRTMGRWSSDCYRLYVRACFEQTLAWTRKLGSQSVHDVQGTYERSAQEVEEYCHSAAVSQIDSQSVVASQSFSSQQSHAQSDSERSVTVSGRSASRTASRGWASHGHGHGLVSPTGFTIAERAE